MTALVSSSHSVPFIADFALIGYSVLRKIGQGSGSFLQILQAQAPSSPLRGSFIARKHLKVDPHFIGGNGFRQGKSGNEESSVFGNGFDDHGWLRSR